MTSGIVDRERPETVGRGLATAIDRHRDGGELVSALVLTSLLNFYELGGGGYGNSYYAAAVKSSTTAAR